MKAREPAQASVELRSHRIAPAGTETCGVEIFEHDDALLAPRGATEQSSNAAAAPTSRRKVAVKRELDIIGAELARVRSRRLASADDGRIHPFDDSGAPLRAFEVHANELSVAAPQRLQARVDANARRPRELTDRLKQPVQS